MKNLKETLLTLKDKQIDALAEELWEVYQDDAEDGIGAYLDIDRNEASKMLNYSTLDEFLSPADLADAMKVYRADGSEESYLRAELRRIKAREAEIKARLKQLDTSKAPASPDIDVFQIYKEGPEKLEKALESLDADQLKAVMKKNRLDSFNQMGRAKDAAKIRDFIIQRTEYRATRGDVFRNYKD